MKQNKFATSKLLLRAKYSKTLLRKIYPEDLSLTQIRYLLLEKRRAVRHSRLERFHRTGRVSPIVGEASAVIEFRVLPSFSSFLLRKEFLKL